MSKRSVFDRNPRDFYKTPYEAVVPLFPFLIKNSRFDAPCAGDGQLVDFLIDYGLYINTASDIFPLRENIKKQDALTIMKTEADVIIENPPWSRDVLHPMIDHFRKLLPTWLLFDADWMHTRQAKPYLPYCSKIVSVGRVKWIPDSKHTGKDNCCWYLFNETEQETRFYGR